MAIELQWGSVSITGNFRGNNEDRCLADPKARYFLVADGMGGQSAGEKASELATEMVSKKLEQQIDFERADPQNVLKGIEDAVAHANAEIMALGEIDPDFHNMGTTITLMVRAGSSLYVGGLGDSRAYLLRKNTLEQLTKDHSLTQALIDAGTISEDEAANHRYKNVLYRYLGTKEGGTGIDAKQLTPESGDRFVLCSDGVTDGIDNAMLLDLMSQYGDPQAAAEAIVAAAEKGGSKDNITCLVVYVK